MPSWTAEEDEDQATVLRWHQLQYTPQKKTTNMEISKYTYGKGDSFTIICRFHVCFRGWEMVDRCWYKSREYYPPKKLTCFLKIAVLEDLIKIFLLKWSLFRAHPLIFFWWVTFPTKLRRSPRPVLPRRTRRERCIVTWRSPFVASHDSSIAILWCLGGWMANLSSTCRR